jgi:hypothetical protein
MAIKTRFRQQNPGFSEKPGFDAWLFVVMSLWGWLDDCEKNREALGRVLVDKKRLYLQSEVALTTCAVTSPLALTVIWWVSWIMKLFPFPCPIILKLLTSVKVSPITPLYPSRRPPVPWYWSPVVYPTPFTPIGWDSISGESLLCHQR